MNINSGALNPSLLRLLQLTSPALPIGAYAYSQGLETAVEAGWVRDEASAQEWIGGLMQHSLAQLDVPVLARLHAAWAHGDHDAVEQWNRFLYASRESAELQLEDRQLGISLARLLSQLDVPQAEPWLQRSQLTLATMFSLAAVQWKISAQDAAGGYLWAWLENQVAAAVKLIPLGQTAGQRMLSAIMADIPNSVAWGLQCADEDIGFTAPALGIASALHETQYTRLFRS